MYNVEVKGKIGKSYMIEISSHKHITSSHLRHYDITDELGNTIRIPKIDENTIEWWEKLALKNLNDDFPNQNITIDEVNFIYDENAKFIFNLNKTDDDIKKYAYMMSDKDIEDERILNETFEKIPNDVLTEKGKFFVSSRNVDSNTLTTEEISIYNHLAEFIVIDDEELLKE
jgi:hypothetical protein